MERELNGGQTPVPRSANNGFLTPAVATANNGFLTPDVNEDGEVILPPLPPVSKWPHKPVYVRINPLLKGFQILNPDPKLPDGCIRVNNEKGFEFETSLFKGRAIIRIKNCPNAPETSYFDKRKRTMQCIVQGVFKREVPFEDVVTGQEFYRELKNLPSRYILGPVLRIFQTLSPAMKKRITNECPAYLVSPLAATAQAIAVSEPGTEPPLEDELVEANELLGGSFYISDSVSSKERKKYFSKPARLKGFTYKPKYVYSFDFYQHMILPNEMLLDVGIKKFALAPVLNGQPFSLMAKSFSTGEFLWSFEVWHESCLLKSKEP